MTPKTAEQLKLMERMRVEEYLRLTNAGAEYERLDALLGTMTASELCFLTDRLTGEQKSPEPLEFVAKAAAVLVGYWMTYNLFVVHIVRLAYMLLFGPHVHRQFFVVAGLTSAAVELSIIYAVLKFERRKYYGRWEKQLAYLKDRVGGKVRQADIDWLDMVPTN
jgi:hypothetical protein